MNKSLLEKKIQDRKAVIAVIGLGYVGLTTATALAEVGFHVIGADIKKEVIDSVSSGKSHTNEPGISDLLKKNIEAGRLRATTNVLKAAKDADVLIICVQTPMNSKNEPDQSFVEKACSSIVGGVSRGKLVVVESTVSPRTTKEIIAKILENGTRLRCGQDFLLAHCPERITVGRALEDFATSPRIVGGYDAESGEIAARLFETVTKGQLLVTDCTSAEVAKLAENAYRYMNIAFANELALLCERLNVDVMEVVRLANTHPRVNVHRPGPGVGGPCLPKDTFLLLHSAKENRSVASLLAASTRTNEYMPTHTVSLLTKALNDIGKELRKSRVIVLGSAYRGGVADARNSPAKKVVRRLVNLGVIVEVYDPFSLESFGMKRIENLVVGAKGADALLIVTDHAEFKNLDLRTIKSAMNKNPIIVDARRIIDPLNAAKIGFKYVGIGLAL